MSRHYAFYHSSRNDTVNMKSVVIAVRMYRNDLKRFQSDYPTVFDWSNFEALQLVEFRGNFARLVWNIWVVDWSLKYFGMCACVVVRETASLQKVAILSSRSLSINCANKFRLVENANVSYFSFPTIVQ